MQVNNPQRNVVYVLGHSPFLREAVETAKPSIDKFGEKYHVKLKVNSHLSTGADAQGDYYVTTTAVVSKANKSRFEKVLHLFGLMPSAKTKTKDLHMMLLDKNAISARSVENTSKAVAAFEAKVK